MCVCLAKWPKCLWIFVFFVAVSVVKFDSGSAEGSRDTMDNSNRYKNLIQSLQKHIEEGSYVNDDDDDVDLERVKRSTDDIDRPDDSLNEWVVDFPGGHAIVKRAVEDAGYNFGGPVLGFNDHYVVSKRPNGELIRRRRFIDGEIDVPRNAEVRWADQQKELLREKRGFVKPRNPFYEDKFGKNMEKRQLAHMVVNDELWREERSYMDLGDEVGFESRGLHTRVHLDIQKVWEQDFIGRGVNILVLDDGLECDHPDLINNCNPDLCFDVFKDFNDSTPRYDITNENRHGTICAGVMIMEANNGICGVGIAFGAKGGAIQMLDGKITDKIEGKSLILKNYNADIITASWGPSDNGKTTEKPGRLAMEGFLDGIRNGRHGLGIIYVWAAGNGGIHDDNCNCDGYVSSIYTINVNSADAQGKLPYFAETCASIISTTYSALATDNTLLISTNLHHSCMLKFSGTSSAAPLVAAMIALALEANPKMSWRDMQHAVIYSSDPRNLNERRWIHSCAGFRYSTKFGFGLLNATTLVEYAKEWNRVPEKNICRMDKGMETEIKSGDEIIVSFETKCEGENRIQYLEHVEVEVTLRHSRRGVLQILLISPAGTKVEVLTTRAYDDDPKKKGIKNHPFMSVATWGENPNGKWKVVFVDTSYGDQHGTIKEVNMVLHGTTEMPAALKKYHRTCKEY